METQKPDTEQQAQATPFQTALNFLIGMRKWGAGRVIAGKAGISQGYFSELVTGRKDGSEPKRRAVAKAFNLPYERFLQLGEMILSGQPGEEALKAVQVLAAREQSQNEKASRDIPGLTPEDMEKAPSELSPEKQEIYMRWLEENYAPHVYEWRQRQEAAIKELAGKLFNNRVQLPSWAEKLANAGINNGTMQAGPASAPHDELSADLCADISARMQTLETPEKVALYTRLKKALEGKD